MSPHDRVLLCEDGDVLELTDDGLPRSDGCRAGYLYVDGIVGDVGQGVLRDRRVLAEEGVVVVVVTVDIADRQGAHRSRDHHPRLGVRTGGRGPARRGVRPSWPRRSSRSLANGVRDVEALERDVRRAAGKFVSERTRRRPMIVPVVMEA